MHMRGILESMLPGDPQCCPSNAVVAEAMTSLVHALHRSASWNAAVNEVILSRLQHVGKLTSLLSAVESEPVAGISNEDDNVSSDCPVITEIDSSLQKDKDHGK